MNKLIIILAVAFLSTSSFATSLYPELKCHKKTKAIDNGLSVRVWQEKNSNKYVMKVTESLVTGPHSTEYNVSKISSKKIGAPLVFKNNEVSLSYRSTTSADKDGFRTGFFKYVKSNEPSTEMLCSY